MVVQSSAIIQAVGVSKEFGGEVVVRDISFEVPRGAIFGFIGPSGSGKTTTIRLVTGVYTPTSGTITVLGRSPQRFTRGTREQIGYMPQLFVLYPDLSVAENLSFAASIYGMGAGRGRRMASVLDFVELSDHRHKLARNISGGMQRRLSLAATLIHDPDLIFLDEPTAGIDPVLRQKFWEHFRELQSEGHTLFITTQYVSETAHCDLVGVMSEGKVLVVDTPEGLRQRVYGGDMVDVHTAERLDYQRLMAIRELPFVRRVQRSDADVALRITVDQANTAMPQLIEWFRAQNIPIESVERYLPPFDDVFVELVRERETA